jgi:hypothetical protein
MAAESDVATITSWAPIVGLWSVEGERVRYLGPETRAGQLLTFGICVTNVGLTDGDILTRVLWSSDDGEGRVLLGYRAPSERYVMAGLRRWESAYAIGEYDPALGFRGLALAGNAVNLPPNQQHDLQVSVTGQRIVVNADGVRVLEHVLEKPLTGRQVGLFAWGKGTVEFTNTSVQSRPGELFVVMEFAEPYKQLYEEVIQPVAKSFGLRAYHAGEVFGPGMILQDIAQGIIDAKVVIAEITPANQNVFYELGYSHALGKPTILLARRDKQLPFDISGYRVLFYENTIGGKKQIEDGLSKHLEAILGKHSRNGN